MKFGIYCSAIIFLLWSITNVVANTGAEDYIIYDVEAGTAYEKELLLRLSLNEKFDFFTLPRDVARPARVLIETADSADFERLLSHLKLPFVLVPEDEYEVDFKNVARHLELTNNSLISFQQYQRHESINNYLEELARLYADRVSVEVSGVSYEGRPLKTITISNGDGVKGKNVILVDAGIHAREWIAPAGALYIIHELVENYAENADLLENYDWIILPVVNPDGYEYTHTNRRMWRKTRKPSQLYCIGTDGNRNFDFHWGEVGASKNCNSDTYRGDAAFSEPETEALRQLMWKHKDKAKFYLTLHSYGNYLLYPWGYTSSLPDNWRDLEDVAQAGAAAIKASTGTKYTVGSSTNVLYAAAGGSDDYALGTVGIPISITMELPAGGSGFNPKPSQILPLVKETWIGIRAMAEKINDKF